MATTTHDDMNRLQARAPGGPVTIAGSLDEAATVTIDGQPASVDGAHNFSGTAQIASGTSTVTVKAKDYSGNETTKQYEIDAVGSTTSYTYDANGNLTSDGTKTYIWNALNQLVEVKEGTTTIATFEYDGGGRRTEKSAAGLTHHYIYDVEDIVEERISGSNSNTRRYYHGAGIDEPLARKNSSDVVTYYLADHLGSIVQETSSVGAVTLEREYDPSGQLLQAAMSSGYAFSGREWDSDIGLYYYRARYFDPRRALFVSEDPSRLRAGPNLYTFVGNQPTNRIDPYGLDWFRPKREPVVFGRDGEAIAPGGWGTLFADYGPAMHTTSQIHDDWVTFLTGALEHLGLSNKNADLLANYPTMIPAFIVAVGKETQNSERQVIETVAQKLRRVVKNPFEKGKEATCR
jgi:RHS repeat-associated protein